MSKGKSDIGLAEVQPPDSYRGKYSLGRLLAIARQLKRGKWLSDEQSYKSRSAANAQAETLIKALQKQGRSREELKRKTWLNGDGGWHWAVRERREE